MKDFDPTRMLWRCPACGRVNAWNWDYCVRAANMLREQVVMCHGSCFDNVCGNCGRDWVREDSPINAECYTHQEA